MALAINSNVGALNAARNLGTSQMQLARSIERLSSGLRINSAKDDAAGLAITDRMSTQVRGMSQAARNANDGVSMLQTAEGALGALTTSLQRIRELAVQASNSTYSVTDRQALQAEADQLIAEIDRVGRQTEFNGLKVFADSENSVVGDENQLAVLDGLKGGWLEQSEDMISRYYGLTADGADMEIRISSFSDGAGGTAARVGSQVGATGKGSNVFMEVDMADFTPPNLPNGGSAPFYNDRIIAHEMVHAVMARSTNYGSLVNNYMWFIEGSAEFIHGADERVLSDGGSTGGGAANLVSEFNNGFSGSSADYSAGYSAVRFLHAQVKAAGGEGIKEVMTYLTQHQNATLKDAIASTAAYANSNADAAYAAFVADFTANGAAFIQGFNYGNADTGAVGGLDVDGGGIKTAESVVGDTGSRSTSDVLVGFNESFESLATTSPERSQVFQVGANRGETITATLGAMSTKALAVSGVSLVDNAQRAIGQLDRALDYVNTQRAKLGAQLNRFETVIANLQIGQENVQASRSRLLDADYAQETASLTRANILQQAGTAILAQANVQPQIALQLLR